jgi:hypothetical protein
VIIQCSSVKAFFGFEPGNKDASLSVTTMMFVYPCLGSTACHITSSAASEEGMDKKGQNSVQRMEKKVDCFFQTNRVVAVQQMPQNEINGRYQSRLSASTTP